MKATSEYIAVVVVVVVKGLRVASEANQREHWARKARRARDQRGEVAVSLAGVGAPIRAALRGARSLQVSFARVGGRTMDSDNLVGAMKHIRDAVALWLGRDDGARSGITWVMPVEQESGDYAVRIRIDAGE